MSQAGFDERLNCSEDKYTIDKLVRTFAEHAQVAEEGIKKYEEECKDEKYPNYDFNLCKALQVICQEIQYLKEKS